MVMVLTLMSAMWADLDHDQNVPKNVRVQVLFEFSLYLDRKLSPEGHGTHHDVSIVGGPDHGQKVTKYKRVQVLFEFSLYLIRKWCPLPRRSWAHPDFGGVGGYGQ